MSFRKNNADGTQKTCKFCHAPVWWHEQKARWYEPGGETLHVKNCEIGKRFHKDEALQRSELQRQRKRNDL